MKDMSAKRVRPAYLAAGTAIVVLAVVAATPFGRNIASQFFSSLRTGSVQTVNVDLSNFVGPNADQTMQKMISQMLADNVKTTISEDDQGAADSAEAGRIAGFVVQLPGERTDVPTLTVSGKHAFTATVDRARLEAILKEADRSDLALPASIEGARIDVSVPRLVRARYGQCPQPGSAAANIATPPPTSTQYSTCLLLNEGPSPDVELPSGLDLQPLAEIGLELAGMTHAQAQEFLRNVDWKSALGVAIPRRMRSYASVKVNGVKGTLFELGGRRGPTYTLIWAKNGMVYSLAGFGNSGDAVDLADSLG